MGVLVLWLVLLGCGGSQRGTIGAVLAQRGDGRVYVRDAPEGLGAEQAGLKPGDEILFIDGIHARAMTAQQVHQALSGPVGAPVKLTVLRDGKIVRLTVTRTQARKYRLHGDPRPGQEPPPKKPQPKTPHTPRATNGDF
jgi:C-terminal processing protease CtpA/Prc